MYKVRLTTPVGSTAHACGTADQAYDKVIELMGRGTGQVTVIDPAGKEWSGADFRRDYESDA